MKVLKKPPKFKMEVVCAAIPDEDERIWGHEEDYCGAALEIEEEDICFRKYAKSWTETGIDYGVTCPCCGSFILVKEIPAYLKKETKQYKKESRRYE